MAKTAAQLRAEQIERLKKWRAEFLQKQEEEQQAILAAKRHAARAERRELRRPPARTWRVGRTLMWDPAPTADQVRPVGYWVSERAPGGNWFMHGDYLPAATAREARLFGDGPARVETVYSQSALGEHYYGEIIEELRRIVRELAG